MAGLAFHMGIINALMLRPDAPPAEEFLLAAALHESGRQQLTPSAHDLLPWPLHVLRSSQVDAQRLDQELVSMLREELVKVFAFFKQVWSSSRSEVLALTPSS